MKKFSKNKFTLIITIVMLFTFLVSTTYASGKYKKNLEAWYCNIRIFNNNQQIYPQYGQEPFIVNGTTYVPLRMMANIFDKNVKWDNNNYTININDKPNSTIIHLMMELAEKDKEIAKLKKQSKNHNKYDFDLGDMENKLNKKHDEYRDIEFEITLSGNEDDITVKIEVDLDDYKKEWDRLSNSKKENYLQDICDDILKEFEDADIDGYIKDSYNRKKLLTFTTSHHGKVKINSSHTSRHTSKNTWDDLEEYLNDEYDNYGKMKFDIDLEGNEDDVTVEIEVDLDDYKKEWDRLSNSKKENYLQDICDDILKEFDDADIDGYIKDSYNKKKLLTFTTSHRGKVKIDSSHTSRHTSKSTWNNLEKYLNDEYDNYGKMKFDIDLEGNEDDITVEIEVDLDDYKKEWDRLSNSKKENYLQDICDDILEEFEDADIDGYIKDSYKNRKIVTFDISSRNKVRVEYK